MAGRKQATTTTNAAAMALLVAAALLAIVTVAPAAATTGPYTMCRVNMVNMKGACEKYCARGSRVAWPGRPCCDAIRGADFDCLCHLKRAIGSMGNIDAGRAMQIPFKCGIPHAPTSC